MMRYRWLIGLGVLAGLAVGIAILVHSREGELDHEGPLQTGNDAKPPTLPSSPPPDAETTATAPPAPAPRSDGDLQAKDDELRAKIVGTWQDEYEGKRTMTLRADGTGTMVVELSGLKAALVAPRLTFHMQWSVAQGRLKKRSLGGEPVVQVNMILKTLGDTVEEEILEATEDRLLLLDPDGKTKYDWRRMR